jgi:hypothetical protein
MPMLIRSLAVIAFLTYPITLAEKIKKSSFSAAQDWSAPIVKKS